MPGSRMHCRGDQVRSTFSYTDTDRARVGNIVGYLIGLDGCENRKIDNCAYLRRASRTGITRLVYCAAMIMILLTRPFY